MSTELSLNYSTFKKVWDTQRNTKEGIEYLVKFRKACDDAYYRGGLLISDSSYDTLNAYLTMRGFKRDLSKDVVKNRTVQATNNVVMQHTKDLKNSKRVSIVPKKIDQVDISSKNPSSVSPLVSFNRYGLDRYEVKHMFPDLMCTLDNCNITNISKKFFDKVKGYPVSKLSIALSIKYDGQSAGLEYIKGKFDSAKTRNDGLFGIQFNKLGDALNLDFNTAEVGLDDEDFAIKCEMVIPLSIFSAANSSGYNNPRSAVQAMSNSIELHKDYDSIRFAPVDIVFKNPEINPTRLEKIEFLKTLHKRNPRFLEPAFIIYDTSEIETTCLQDIIDSVESVHNEVLLDRNQFDNAIDGLVIEFVDQDVIDDLGFTPGKPGHPNYAQALKFPPKEEITEVLDIEYDFGYRTGRITPMARIKPVFINNNKYDRPSLHNFARLRKMKLGKGSKVVFTLNEDVMGYVSALDSDDDTIVPFKEISECPICNSPLYKNEVFAYCVNNECEGNKIGKFLGIFKEMGIQGVAESTLKTLLSTNKLNHMYDLYYLTYEDLLELPGFEEKKAKLVIQKIKEINGKFDYQLLASLPIEGIGPERAKALLDVFDLDTLINDPSISGKILAAKIPDIGKETAMLCSSISNYKQELETFVDLFHIRSFKEVSNKTDSLKVAISGSVAAYPDGRIAFIAKLQELGHTVSPNFAADLDYLITDESMESNNSKIRKAIAKNITVISSEDFIKTFEIPLN